MFAVRMLVTLAILVPLWIWRQPHDTLEIFVIAIIGFGAGHIVEALLKARKRAGDPPAPSGDSRRG